MARVEVPAEFADNPSAYVSAIDVPDLAAAGYSKAMYQGSPLSMREFEGARMRTAQINGAWRPP